MFTEDATYDFSGPKHPLYKKWTGGPTCIKPWFKFLDDSEFPNMTPKFFPAPTGSHQVMCNMSYDWHYKGSVLNNREDIFVFTVEGGKVKSMKQYWGDVKSITEVMAPKIPADNYGM